MTRTEIAETVARIERREVDRRMASRMDAGRRLVDARKHNQAVMQSLELDALHLAITGNVHDVAIMDFKPAPIVDSVGFDDVWGDAR